MLLGGSYHSKAVKLFSTQVCLCVLGEGEEELYRMGGRFKRRFPMLLGGSYHSKAVKLFSTQVCLCVLGEGEEELYRMCGRFRRRFATSLGGSYHNKAVKLFSMQVRSAEVARSAASAVAFAIGLLENSGSLTFRGTSILMLAPLYSILSTPPQPPFPPPLQVARSAASAVAFAIGLLENSGSLTPARLRAFPVISETQEGDTKLRFHNLCGAYAAVKENAQGPLDEGWEILWGEIALDINKQLGLVPESPEAQKRGLKEEGVRGEVARDGIEQLGLEHGGLERNGTDGRDAGLEAAGGDLTAYDVSGLWLQCKHESGVLLRGGGGREGEANKGDRLDTASRACGLFSARHLAVLEWIDDVDTFMQKGYGREINYHMGLKLLQELNSPNEAASKEDKRDHQNENQQQQLDQQQQQKLQEEGPHHDKYDVLMAKVAATITQQFAPPVPLPPVPPLHRRWQASQIAPYAANTAVILFRCGPNGTDGLHMPSTAASISGACDGGGGGNGGDSAVWRKDHLPLRYFSESGS
ncbi:unnamed protein product [Closterium sp. Yama58-4]|nr:unnamed protein product [Closterium sp. Yama58-4]